MIVHMACIALIVLVPVVAIFIEWLSDSGVIERHHGHHDTYLVPRSITSSLLLMMVFVGVLGVVVDWLCDVGVFNGDGFIIGVFFATFLVITLMLWAAIRRYRVVTTDDSLQVRPFVGPVKTISYSDVTDIWSTHRTITNYHNLRVFAGKDRVFLWGIVDVDQILTRMDRFDVMHDSRIY